jgi:hypothetical protein
MALETLNNRYDIRHFEDGGSTGDPIEGLYGSILNRGSDPEGLAFWQNAYNTGTSLADIESGFRNSQEAQAKAQTQSPSGNVTVQSAGSEYDNAQPINQTITGPLSTTLPGAKGTSNIAFTDLNKQTPPPPLPSITEADIAGLYTNVLDRPLDPEGFNFWLDSARKGASLDTIKQAFLDSQEYKAKPATTTAAPVQSGLTTPGSTQAVTDWFKTNLFREPTQAELTSYSQAFGNTLDPTELTVLNQTPTAQNLKGIDTAYQQKTGRKGSADEYNTWLQTITNGRSLADVQKDIANSTEAQLYSAFNDTMGRVPDPLGAKYYQDQLAAGKTIAQIRAEMAASDEGQKYAVNSLYKNALFRDATPDELTENISLLKQGNTLDQIREKTFARPDVIVAQDYKKYLGRPGSADEYKFWTDSLAAGQTKQQIAQAIAFSDESIKFNSPIVKSVLEATLGKNFVAGLTPEQIAHYTRTILDPNIKSTAKNTLVSQKDFDADWYAKNNPGVTNPNVWQGDLYSHYIAANSAGDVRYANAADAAAKKDALKTENEKLQDIYREIALDPVLGAKLRAENPLLWEQVTPLTNRPEDVKTTDRIRYGQFGTVKVEGMDVPILNGIRADQLFGADGFDTISDFSHHRGRTTNDLGWSSNSFSNKFARGAQAIGVTAEIDGEGNTYYQGIDGAAKLVGIDPSKFQDKQVETKATTDKYNEQGELVQRAGDITTQTISRDQQLFDAVNQAAKDIYLYTGDSLTTGKAREGGAESFNTVMYKRVGDELIPISKPFAHGGAQNMDVYRPKDYGFSYYAQGPILVGSMALAAATAGGSFAATGGLAATVGSAVGLTGTAAVIGGGIIVGSAMSALNAAASDGNVGKAALTGAVVGGITSAMQPLMNAGSMKDAISAVSEASGGFFSPQQLSSIIATTLATTAGSAVGGANGDQIFKSFATSLAANGISQGAVSSITAALKDSGITPDAMAKIARATQLAGSTIATSALSGKNQEQIMNNLISQFTDPSKLATNVMNVATTKATPPKIEPTNPFGTENIGMTSGSVDNVLQSQIMDGIANNSDDPIAFMNAAKNWTGNGSENVAFVTTEMVRQGMPADEISADLQQLYRIPADKANEYAQYMASKVGTKTTPITKTTATTTTQDPTNVVTQTSVAAPNPQLYDTLVDMFKNPEVLGPAIATLAQANPVSRFDTGYSTSGLTSGTTQGNLGGADPANDPRTTRAQSPRIGGDEYSNVYPSVTGKASQDVNYIRELVEAYKADPTYAPIAQELQKLDPKNAVFSNVQNTEVERTQVPATNAAPPLYSGKQVTITGYPELSALPKPVEAPTPMAPDPMPMPMPAEPSPNKPANDPFIIPEPKTPGRPITPIMPVSPPGALPKIAPGSLPLTNPGIVPTPGIQPVSPTTPATPATPATPTTPTTPTKPSTEPVQDPNKNPQSAPTPEQQSVIQKVAKTPQDAKRLEIAVPKVTQLITQGVPKTVAIPKVAIETGAPIEELTTIIEVTVPEVPTVTVPTVVPAPTVKAPTPTTKTPAVKVPTPVARKSGVISPFLMQEYGGIQDLSPGLTGGGNYSLSGIPSTDTNMNPMMTNNPLQQFASTSPPSPLELGAQQQPNELMQMAAGGSTSQQAYNPYDVSSGISGSLTPGLTKARLDYLLTGLPQNKAEGGSIEGHNPQFFSEGGLGSMDNTFVQGEGDGTSDQVPAMLANGEFVIPADVVSGLGNGSNDAGAEVLQEFLKAIREHKHSAKADKLPPGSKGPLAYLTNAKRKVKVA